MMREGIMVEVPEALVEQSRELAKEFAAGGDRALVAFMLHAKRAYGNRGTPGLRDWVEAAFFYLRKADQTDLLTVLLEVYAENETMAKAQARIGLDQDPAAS
jgi:hypothetical protein